MAIDFPASPTTGQSFTDNTTGQTWIYNGTGWASSYNRSSVVRQSFTASAGQTTFTVSGGYAPGLLDVYQNGVKLVSGSDYTASNGTTVILTAAATAGDSVEVWGVANFAVANAPTFAQVYAREGDAGPIVMRNRIINGAMEIDQRNAGAALTLAASTAYTVDRWAANRGASSTATVQRSSVAPSGFVNSLLYTVGTGASPVASDYAVLVQYVEGTNIADLGWGAAGAQSVTLSFRVRSSVAGTYGVVLQNASQNMPYATTYTINNANTWETKSITIPGPTSGTWATNNTVGIQVIFDMGVGSTQSIAASSSWQSGNYIGVSGATKIVATAGATFYLTGVQLEVGGTATPFERRLYSQELAMCQRYYEVGNVLGGAYYQNVTGNAADKFQHSVFYKATKRATATVVVNNLGGGTLTTNFTTADMFAVYSTGTMTTTMLYASWTASAEL